MSALLLPTTAIQAQKASCTAYTVDVGDGADEGSEDIDSDEGSIEDDKEEEIRE
ncbi:hypothetical protein SERLADRAFT_456850 [Serpula lacrymans var. lacrymans S7.9]|uniref:Uncharacterized protein n=1 Tax=Serpula lacrymans var. lacrymans (strain S7.9) TaxID=578457 RepID=F8NJ09_SERL9|nr:uncharacterized protein SERLADRAFT_456850 [Serpula lacrymans var. lacrymans S7.9]EGO29290.1 hypothetical protein SERLADRAFT_456850 [Serpula lacrymans var. lacrymans S7.9]